MVVMKRSHEEQVYSIDKLAQSIRAAHAGTEESLDIDLLIAEFQSIVMDKDFITTGQIYSIVCGLLYTKGVQQTLEHYSKFTKN